MITLNTGYNDLKTSYLFYNIAQKTEQYKKENPGVHLLRLGIGDVSQPLCPAVIRALHAAVDDQAEKETFHGYMPECGAAFLREAICGNYTAHGVALSPDEIFVSSGASDDLGDILDLFDRDNTVLIMEPAYPAYVDANIIARHRIIHYSPTEENNFTPLPNTDIDADLIYICSPNNPTGAVFNRTQLKAWVDYANQKGAVILFDAAYQAFIEDPDIPRSIYEIEDSQCCAIEICSFSKTAGFTGTRCGYTIVPKALVRGGMSLHSMWVRSRTTKTNGVSYIIQRGAAAIYTDEGQTQIRDIIAIYKKNAAVLMEALDRCGIWYCGGKNAPYIWLRCPGGMGSWAFFDFLLRQAQIIGTPGEGFGACGDGYFRLSTFGSISDTTEAAKRIIRLFAQ